MRTYEIDKADLRAWAEGEPIEAEAICQAIRDEDWLTVGQAVIRRCDPPVAILQDYDCMPRAEFSMTHAWYTAERLSDLLEPWMGYEEVMDAAEDIRDAVEYAYSVAIDEYVDTLDDDAGEDEEEDW